MSNLIELTSAQNPFLQSIRKAVHKGRATDDGLLVAEGPHLLYEALRSSCEVEKIVVTHEAYERMDLFSKKNFPHVIVVAEKAFQSIASTETSQGVLALVRLRDWTWSDLLSTNTLIVALDGIQEPGNAGTILRSAEAFGSTGAVLLKGTAHLANPKLLRATAGSVFRIPLLASWTPEQLLDSCRKANLPIFVLASGASCNIHIADLGRPCALVIGNEGQGVSATLMASATPIAIPTMGVESLNAAAACSIALYEASRQRSLP